MGWLNLRGLLVLPAAVGAEAADYDRMVAAEPFHRRA